jgi:hypothetical protein
MRPQRGVFATTGRWSDRIAKHSTFVTGGIPPCWERVVALNLGETNHPLGFRIPNFQTQTTEDFHWLE